MKRESGYYWVKLRNRKDFIVAEYVSDQQDWYICARLETYSDNDFSEILPEKITLPF